MSIKKIRTIKDIREKKATLKIEMKAIEGAVKSSIVQWSKETPKSVAKAGLSILGVEAARRMMASESAQEEGGENEKPFYYPLMHMALDKVIGEIEDRI